MWYAAYIANIPLPVNYPAPDVLQYLPDAVFLYIIASFDSLYACVENRHTILQIHLHLALRDTDTLTCILHEYATPRQNCNRHVKPALKQAMTKLF